MLYEIGLNTFDIFMYFGIIALIAVSIFLLIKFKKMDEAEIVKIRYGASAKLILIFLMVFFSIGLVFSVSEKAYSIYKYHNQEYEVIQGSIENFEWIYAHNSYEKIGISFSVKEKQFVIREGIMNSGYSLYDNIITENGQEFVIYYMPSSTSNSIEKILRIDSVNSKILINPPH